MSVKLMLCAILPLVATPACTGPATPPTFTLEEDFGSMEITTLTTGTNLDADGYTLMIDEARSQPIAINETVALSNLVVGRYVPELTDVAPNCLVVAPGSITVSANGLTPGLFTVTCS